MVVPKGSKFEINIVQADGSVKKNLVFEFKDSAGVVMGMYNTDDVSKIKCGE